MALIFLCIVLILLIFNVIKDFKDFKDLKDFIHYSKVKKKTRLRNYARSRAVSLI